MRLGDRRGVLGVELGHRHRGKIDEVERPRISDILDGGTRLVVSLGHVNVKRVDAQFLDQFPPENRLSRRAKSDKPMLTTGTIADRDDVTGSLGEETDLAGQWTGHGPRLVGAILKSCRIELDVRRVGGNWLLGHLVTLLSELGGTG